MTHYKSLIDTEWLGQWDIPIGKKVVLTIASVNRYKPERPKTKKDPATGRMVPEKNKRVDIGFEKAKKHWLAGPVSQTVIAKLYGRDVEGWIGKRITLYVDDDVTMGREKTGGVRVEPKVPTGQGGARLIEDAIPSPEKVEQLERAREQVAGDNYERPEPDSNPMHNIGMGRGDDYRREPGVD